SETLVGRIDKGGDALGVLSGAAALEAAVGFGLGAAGLASPNLDTPREGAAAQGALAALVMSAVGMLDTSQPALVVRDDTSCHHQQVLPRARERA
ncbi:hypothetical protein MNEG_2431, partial [Monoraphidium neglectum]